MSFAWAPLTSPLSSEYVKQSLVTAARETPVPSSGAACPGMLHTPVSCRHSPALPGSFIPSGRIWVGFASLRYCASQMTRMCLQATVVAVGAEGPRSHTSQAPGLRATRLAGGFQGPMLESSHWPGD